MKKTKLPSIVSILILTLITVLVWVTFDVYRLFHKVEPPVVPESVSLPLNPVLDTETINRLESKTLIDEASIPDQVAGTKSVEIPVQEEVAPVDETEASQ